MYKLIKNPMTGNVDCVSFNNLVIPFDPDNTDYQQYLAWVAEGNTPEPADQGE